MRNKNPSYERKKCSKAIPSLQTDYNIDMMGRMIRVLKVLFHMMPITVIFVRRNCILTGYYDILGVLLPTTVSFYSYTYSTDLISADQG